VPDCSGASPVEEATQNAAGAAFRILDICFRSEFVRRT
jgi:hypothetical protein